MATATPTQSAPPAVPQQLATAVTGVAPAGQILKNQDLLQASMLVPKDVRQFIARRSLRSQVSNRPGKQYYSTVRFQFLAAPEPNVVPPTWVDYTLPQGQRVAFSYGVQDDASAAGFPQTFRPTECETNLITRSDTGGAIVKITGISFHLSATSDAGLAAHVFDNVFADISLDGSNRYMLLGRLDRVPQSGGLYGSGASLVTQPPLNTSIAQVGALTNGMPIATNFLKLPEPITWNPASRIDSRFQIRLNVVRPIAMPRANARIGALPNGVAEYRPPAGTGDRGTYVDLIVYMHAREIAPRSAQA